MPQTAGLSKKTVEIKVSPDRANDKLVVKSGNEIVKEIPVVIFDENQTKNLIALIHGSYTRRSRQVVKPA